MADMENQIMGALGYPMLPQSIVPVTNTKTQVQGVAYDPNKMKALLDALQAKRNKEIGTMESIANALAGMPAQQNFKGAYGVDVVNPWAAFTDSAVRSFGNAYSKRKDYERAQADKEREDAIKAAEVAFDADKKAVTDTVENTNMKVNDPNSKEWAAMQEKAKNARVLDSLSRDLENIGTRFDEDFKNIDDMQQNSTRWGRAHTNAWWGIGTTDSEKLARDEFNAWKGSMKNVLVNANRQAGSGNMSDADAARYEQDIGKAKTPAEARNILRSFQKRMVAENGPQTTINGFTIIEE